MKSLVVGLVVGCALVGCWSHPTGPTCGPVVPVQMHTVDSTTTSALPVVTVQICVY